MHRGGGGLKGLITKYVIDTGKQHAERCQSDSETRKPDSEAGDEQSLTKKVSS